MNRNHLTSFHSFVYFWLFETDQSNRTSHWFLKWTPSVFFTLQVLNQTHDHRQRVLHNVAKELPNWAIMVRKMKAIYHTMNLFNVDVTKKCLIGECWVPVSDLTIVRDCLNEGSVGSSNFTSFFYNNMIIAYNYSDDI